MKLGLIGTGIIGEAFVRGLINVGRFEDEIWVSRRSDSRSASLAADFAQISIANENQEILDRCDTLILAVLPEQVESVLQDLQFRDDHLLLSIVSSITLKSLSQWAAPCTQIYRGIPLPPIEFGVGPIPICPPCPQLEPMLSSVGTVVSLTDEDQFLSIAVGSALMAMFYEMVSKTAMFMQKGGLPPHESALYATSMWHALAGNTTRVDHQELHQMSNDCLTPGGLNEQVLFGLRDANWYGLLEKEMDGIKERLSRY